LDYTEKSQPLLTAWLHSCDMVIIFLPLLS